MGDVTKSFLYAWCGKNKVVPAYDVKSAGNKQRQRFLCEVKSTIILLFLFVCIMYVSELYLNYYFICFNDLPLTFGTDPADL